MKRTYLIALIAPMLMAAGCEQQYRYPCQNPANWETEQCKKPLCEVNKDCPEYIFKEDKPKPAVMPSAPAPVKGECK